MIDEWIHCGKGICAAEEGHEGTCAEASGWPNNLPCTQLPSGNTSPPDYRPVIAPDHLREQEYTPKTEEVRSDFILSPGNKDWEAARLLAFDRWLSAAITEAKAEALEEAADARFTDEIQGAYTSAPTWLRARAAEYRTPKETNNA